jgi:hypothetical protein
MSFYLSKLIRCPTLFETIDQLDKGGQLFVQLDWMFNLIDSQNVILIKFIN